MNQKESKLSSHHKQEKSSSKTDHNHPATNGSNPDHHSSVKKAFREKPLLQRFRECSNKPRRRIEKPTVCTWNSEQLQALIKTFQEYEKAALDDVEPTSQEQDYQINAVSIEKTCVIYDHIGGTYRTKRIEIPLVSSLSFITNEKHHTSSSESPSLPNTPPALLSRSSSTSSISTTKSNTSTTSSKATTSGMKVKKKKNPFMKVYKKLKLKIANPEKNIAKPELIEKYFPNLKLPDDFVYILENERSSKTLPTAHNDNRCNCTSKCVKHECLNYLSQVECSSDCQCGSLCDNKMFTNMQYPNIVCFYSKGKGIGVKCNQPIIKKGEFITEYVGEVISIKRFEKRTSRKYHKSLHHYCMNLNENEIIDATWMGNIGRFINHSCDPNACTQVWSVNGYDKVGIFAIRDIMFGEEITYNYHFTIYDEVSEQQVCKCGAETCTGVIGKKPSSPSFSGSSDSEADTPDESENESEGSPKRSLAVSNVESNNEPSQKKQKIDESNSEDDDMSENDEYYMQFIDSE
ncbi:hypothetical protein C9374_000996 [Naegleria lovaniensis]|uniref:SET domain-containing protein n=1 Tax=Naegleria lovaniensis TaxID=51637 RepID=A0AA88KGX7_NAELO|nr:uncharacterized protein C9374_014717 [Naegleria lovaniensis]XP_044552138.1 uncharacterized protein C9374_000996 [Naegleria lovaniensis]KAG2370633.1 hypothetical protein C9374_014717 [Naegleria lovaniensis]KAG2388146.1 hypothetical protein C9374_000996 [Naegleria lovaniensis]